MGFWFPHADTDAYAITKTPRPALIEVDYVDEWKGFCNKQASIKNPKMAIKLFFNY